MIAVAADSGHTYALCSSPVEIVVVAIFAKYLDPAMRINLNP